MENKRDGFEKCPYCFLEFRFLAHLEQHIKDEHKKANFCCVCEEPLDRESDRGIIDHGDKAICGQCGSNIHNVYLEAERDLNEVPCAYYRAENHKHYCTDTRLDDKLFVEGKSEIQDICYVGMICYSDCLPQGRVKCWECGSITGFPICPACDIKHMETTRKACEEEKRNVS